MIQHPAYTINQAAILMLTRPQLLEFGSCYPSVVTYIGNNAISTLPRCHVKLEVLFPLHDQPKLLQTAANYLSTTS